MPRAKTVQVHLDTTRYRPPLDDAPPSGASKALLASVNTSFNIATSALVQGNTILGMLGFEGTKKAVASVVDDLREATKQLEANDRLHGREGSEAE